MLKQYKIHKIESSDHKTIRSWIINLSSNDFTSTTINRKIASLKSFFKYLISREKINKNPSKKIPSLKKERILPKFIKENDMKLIFDKSKFKNNILGMRDLLILELLYGTGIRLSELINLKLRDYDKTKSQIKVLGKRNKERIIPLNKNVELQIINYLNLKKNKIIALLNF